MGIFRRDLQHAFRVLRKNPGFTAVVVLTLGLGIGANTAIFSLMDQVLLRTLPVRDPAQLVLLDGPGAFQGRTFNDDDVLVSDVHGFPRPERGVRRRARALSDRDDASPGRDESERAQRRDRHRQLLRRPRRAARRSAASSTQRTTAPRARIPVAVLSHGYWQRRFGGDPSRARTRRSSSTAIR